VIDFLSQAYLLILEQIKCEKKLQISVRNLPIESNVQWLLHQTDKGTGNSRYWTLQRLMMVVSKMHQSGTRMIITFVVSTKFIGMLARYLHYNVFLQGIGLTAAEWWTWPSSAVLHNSASAPVFNTISLGWKVACLECQPSPFPFGRICFVVLAMRKGGEPLKLSLAFTLYIESFPFAQRPGPVHAARLGWVCFLHYLA